MSWKLQFSVNGVAWIETDAGEFETQAEALAEAEIRAMNKGLKPESYRAVEGVCNPAWLMGAPTRDIKETTKIAPPSYTEYSVTKQPHYAQLNPEPADVIEAWHLNWRLANVVKYVARAGRKGSAEDHIKDMEKAVAYAQRELNVLRGKRGWDA